MLSTSAPNKVSKLCKFKKASEQSGAFLVLGAKQRVGQKTWARQLEMTEGKWLSFIWTHFGGN
jgi:hypothetical protein